VTERGGGVDGSPKTLGQRDSRTLTLGAAAGQAVDQGRGSPSEDVRCPTQANFERGGLAIDLSDRGMSLVLAKIPGFCQMTSALGFGNPPFFHRDPQVVANTAANGASDMLE